MASTCVALQASWRKQPHEEHRLGFSASSLGRLSRNRVGSSSSRDFSSVGLTVRAASGRPKRSVAQKDSESRQYYFSTEGDDASTSSPISSETATLIAGAVAVVGLGFGKRHFSACFRDQNELGLVSV